MIKAIETVYKDYRFRSRLEARWAVFFDTLGIKWEYEKEGYDLEGVWYLPDFWLPEQECFVEIKGQKPTLDEHLKASRLAWASKKDVMLFAGNIEKPHTSAFVYYPGMDFYSINWRGVLCPYFSDQEQRRYGAVVSFTPEGFAYGNTRKPLATLLALELFIEAREAGFYLSFTHDKASFVFAYGNRQKTGVSTHRKLQSRLDALMGDAVFPDLCGVWIPTNGQVGTLLRCPKCKRISVGVYDVSTPNKCSCGGLQEEEIGMEEAYTAARQARFEHGEKPKGRRTRK